MCVIDIHDNNSSQNQLFMNVQPAIKVTQLLYTHILSWAWYLSCIKQALVFLLIICASVMRASFNFIMGDCTLDDVCQQCKETRCEQDSEDVAQVIKSVKFIALKLLLYDD